MFAKQGKFLQIFFIDQTITSQPADPICRRNRKKHPRCNQKGGVTVFFFKGTSANKSVHCQHSVLPIIAVDVGGHSPGRATTPWASLTLRVIGQFLV